MARRNTDKWVKPVDNTMVLFTSMTLIILTFFIMLTAKANFDETKYGKVVESVYDTFGILTGGLSVIGSDSGLVLSESSLGDPSAVVTVRDPEMARIRALLAPEILDGGARIIHNRGQRVVSLSADVVFAPDSSEISPNARETLLAFCRVMRDSDVPINVEGHTDNLPPTTQGVDDNWDLSMDRALSVTNLFINEGGLSPTRLVAYGYAGYKPMVANKSPANRARNNRIDLVLDFEASKVGALKGLTTDGHLFDFEGFEFVLPTAPGGEEVVY
ncbi:MAG: flagellar motor protein MotB [Deltaproteobacteria bacterium]|jgi:chemotaxis protein MotB|nr:flagellar motor protein MotB [Deltaproteobacteria bacterium]